MRLYLNWIMSGCLLFVSSIAVAEEKQESTEDAKPFLTIKVVDEAGKPVEGARTGMIAVVNGYDREQGAKWSFGHFEQKSDAEGIIRFHNPDKYRGMVYVRHAGRSLVAVKRTDLLGDLPSPLILTMSPACHVTWKIESSQLDQRGKEIGAVRGFSSAENMICQWCNESGSILHFYLPPGIFTLVAAGESICPVEKNIEIKAGQTELDAGTTDTAALKYKLLTGKPAPEIVDVQEWKNGPVKLSQLRGKVVVLEFWGWWCGPCVIRGIPELFQLREEYSKDDLAIVGIHVSYGEDDEVNSIGEMDEKLAQVREKVWKGKQIDFPVAFTRNRKLAFAPGGAKVAHSRMSVEYGINEFPTLIVIDRQGNVFGKLMLWKKADREKLKQLIEAK
ncbi:Thiol-disulfide oxidoreductase ResA [Gimesia panareensis]|uniref:Thiol-disulfide oxidoreductase ResA n=1 Tax=Gimesia panareensis TaxID=2527978 RepID=A0A518FI69_9PLAN|nr:TlpA disulfide reductase family protein [Gimesia panareensis]QDV15960.1 Thiol-disulfide oxidoreductase ResA [Gimesia panareensis]